jgi:hypothetical protein
VIAAERLAEYAFDRGLYHQCIDTCAIALDADPAADDMVSWLLQAYAGAGLDADLEHAYRNYLHAAGLDALSAAGQRDDVVQLYQSLGRAGALGCRCIESRFPRAAPQCGGAIQDVATRPLGILWVPAFVVAAEGS